MSTFGANSAVIEMRFTGFRQGAANIRKAIAQTPAIMNARIKSGVMNAVREIAVESLMAVTPVLTGRLQRSTRGILNVENGQVTLLLEQPATDESGQTYARYLIEGHYTQTGVLVPPNAYPQEAWANMRGRVNTVLREVAQRIGEDISHVMGGTQPLGSL